jgi:hypothetical protein
MYRAIRHVKTDNSTRMITGSTRLGETMYIARARTGSMCTSRSPDGPVDGGLLRRLGDWRGRRIRYRRRRRNRYGRGRRRGRRRVRGGRCSVDVGWRRVRPPAAGWATTVAGCVAMMTYSRDLRGTARRRLSRRAAGKGQELFNLGQKSWVASPKLAGPLVLNTSVLSRV